jgi:hypothetical protein
MFLRKLITENYLDVTNRPVGINVSFKVIIEMVRKDAVFEMTPCRLVCKYCCHIP